MLRPIDPFIKKVKDLAELLGATVDIADSQGETSTFSGVTSSSIEVESGDVFFALPGQKIHGAHYASDAQALGAVAVVTDEEGSQLISGLPVLIVSNARRAAAIASAWFFNEPMRDMFSVGVTGTNGKTTITTLCHQLLTGSQRQSGLIGTIETRIGLDAISSKRTTPEASELQALVAVMRERHCRTVVMEVSSHAIELERIRGGHFNLVAFTNLSQDHLDFHTTMEEYFQAKAKLFSFEYAEAAFVNIDDAYGKRLAEEIEIPTTTISRLEPSADWHYSNIDIGRISTALAVRGKGGILIETTTQLHGGYNLDNLLMAIAIVSEDGMDPVEIAALVPFVTGAIGRLEPVQIGQDFGAFVDYAHSPDAVRNVLLTLREMTQKKIIAVLGCGGDRDRSKRNLMGQALVDGADIAVFTSDNPRSEDPHSILDEMTKDLQLTELRSVVVDREAAIRWAVNQAQPGDIVVVLGKGHEQGQEIAGVLHPFDDRRILAVAIEAKR